MADSLEQEIRALRSLFWSDRDPAGRGFAPLADAYRRSGDLEQALELVRDGVDRLPEFASGHFVAGLVFGAAGEGSAAARAFERVLELDPGNMVAQRHLSELRTGVDSGVASEPGPPADADAEPFAQGDLTAQSAGSPPAEPAPDPSASPDGVDLDGLELELGGMDFDPWGEAEDTRLPELDRPLDAGLAEGGGAGPEAEGDPLADAFSDFGEPPPEGGASATDAGAEAEGLAEFDLSDFPDITLDAPGGVGSADSDAPAEVAPDASDDLEPLPSGDLEPNTPGDLELDTAGDLELDTPGDLELDRPGDSGADASGDLELDRHLASHRAGDLELDPAGDFALDPSGGADSGETPVAAGEEGREVPPDPADLEAAGAGAQEEVTLEWELPPEPGRELAEAGAEEAVEWTLDGEEPAAGAPRDGDRERAVPVESLAPDPVEEGGEGGAGTVADAAPIEWEAIGAAPDAEAQEPAADAPLETSRASAAVEREKEDEEDGREDGPREVADADGNLYTRTMAELYARQGLHQRAADVYERLLEADPENREFRDRLEELRDIASGRRERAPEESAAQKRDRKSLVSPLDAGLLPGEGGHHEAEGAARGDDALDDAGDDVETMAPQWAAADAAGGEELSSPFVWTGEGDGEGGDEAEDRPAASGGRPIAGYFENLLAWVPGAVPIESLAPDDPADPEFDSWLDRLKP